MENYSQHGTQPSQGTGKPVIRRRSWTTAEENCLEICFKEIIACGWKTQNGFKNGFLMQLEQRMRVMLPSTDIRGNPHINSKYGTWKTKFREVWACINNSGFNWCSSTKTVQATPGAWEDLIKAHPSLSDVRDRVYPYYNTWFEMFASDTACGVGAKASQSYSKKTQKSATPHINLDDDETSPNAASPTPGIPKTDSPVEDGTSRAATPPVVDQLRRGRRWMGFRNSLNA